MIVEVLLNGSWNYTIINIFFYHGSWSIIELINVEGILIIAFLPSLYTEE